MSILNFKTIDQKSRHNEDDTERKNEWKKPDLVFCIILFFCIPFNSVGEEQQEEMIIFSNWILLPYIYI